MMWEQKVQQAMDNAKEQGLGVLQQLAIEVVRKRAEANLPPWRGTEEDAAPTLNQCAEEKLLMIFNTASDARVLGTVAFLLGEIGGANSVEALVNALGIVKDRAVQAAVVEALGKIGGLKAIKTLIHCACTNPDELIRGTAVQALRRILERTNPLKKIRFGSSLVKEIEDILNVLSVDDPSPYVRAMAGGLR
ncbi:MAG: HEAT repeat domain-containing protein [Candidatus Hadarchaeum sp.]